MFPNDFDEYLIKHGINPQNKQLNSDEFRRRFMEYHDDTNEDLKLLDMGYDLYKFLKFDPYQIRKNGRYVVILVAAIRFLMIGLIFLMVSRNYGDIIYVINCVKSISAYLQGMAKLIPHLIYPENIIYIRLAVIKYFWKTCATGKQTENYSFWYKVMLIYKYAVYLTLFALILHSLVSRVLMFPVYIPDIPFAFITLLLMQYYQFFIDAITVVGMDLIFLSMCILIWRQCKMLFNEFAIIDGNNGYGKTMEDFSRCVQHHNIILNYVNCVINTFTIPLLFQYLISILGMCIDLYIVSENPSLLELIASCIYLTMLSAQLGLYCFMADKTSEMVQMIAFFIDNTKWYDNPAYLNKMLVTVICRSQKNVSFTAGGMSNIDKQAFTKIFRTTLSFFTLVRQLKEK